jgi:ferredoxin, 2Fe-2S
MPDEIQIHVQLPGNARQTFQAPTDLNLSLMEFLKANNFDIMATCGGMALCATCHVEILSGFPLPEPADAELDILDSLPVLTAHSRLSCQLRLAGNLDGLTVRIVSE